MPQFNNIMIVLEESVGESTALLFPKFSSCTGVVAVLANALVGAHMTEDLWPDEDPKKHTKKTLDLLVKKIAGRQVDRLLIVGFNGNHNPKKLAGYLGVPTGSCDAYDVARKNISEMTVIVSHVGPGVRPKVEYKRQSKVTSTPHPNPDFKMDDLDKGQLGAATTGKLHELRKNFVGVV